MLPLSWDAAHWTGEGGFLSLRTLLLWKHLVALLQSSFIKREDVIMFLVEMFSWFPQTENVIFKISWDKSPSGALCLCAVDGWSPSLHLLSHHPWEMRTLSMLPNKRLSFSLRTLQPWQTTTGGGPCGSWAGSYHKTGCVVTHDWRSSILKYGQLRAKEMGIYGPTEFAEEGRGLMFEVKVFSDAASAVM